jgi:4-amino-4-deoxy-L-arabinose transferase-like glycosyltransferase
MGLSTAGRRAWVAGGAALAVGLALRLWLVSAYPFEAGDTPLYEALARNIGAHGAYALEVDGQLTPVNVRMPGYPAFLAACHALFGPGFQPVRVAQAVLDTLTCLLAGLVAGLLAAPERRRRAFLAGLWLAALCPFCANYASAILAETPGAFFTTGAFALAFAGLRRAENAGDRDHSSLAWLVAAGAAAGLGCYFRPETPLLLVATGLVLALWWRRPADWPRLARTGLALGAGLALALAPWVARNALVLGSPQLLPPMAANLPGETAPVGFNAWTDTWLTTVPEIYAISFKVEDEALDVAALPPSACDSPEEKARVAALFARHNRDFTLDADLDGAFAQLARERTARHPLRTWLVVPLRRIPAMWLSPRVDLLPYSGQLLPLAAAWEDDPVDFSVSATLFALNLVYLVLAALGAWRAGWRTGAWALGAWLLLRTALLTRMPGPEPRYVVVCFPILAALAAQAWAAPRRGASPATP